MWASALPGRGYEHCPGVLLALTPIRIRMDTVA